MSKKKKKDKNNELNNIQNDDVELNISDIDEDFSYPKNRKKKRSNTLYYTLSIISILLTLLSNFLTASNLIADYINIPSNETSINGNNLVILNQTNYNNQINYYSLNIKPIFDSAIFYSIIAASAIQVAFVSIDIGKLNWKFFTNNSIAQYIKNNSSNNFFLSLFRTLMLKKPKDSERRIEENFAKYILYKSIDCDNINIDKDNSAIFDRITGELYNQVIDIECRLKMISYWRKFPEINLFAFRLLENSEANVLKRRLRIVKESWGLLQGERKSINSVISKDDIDNFLKEYERDLKLIKEYSKKQIIFWTAITQNMVWFSQCLDVIVTAFGSVAVSFFDRKTFFRNYSIIALFNGVSWMGYDLCMSRQKEYEVVISNVSKLLSLESVDDINHVLTHVMNPSYSIESIRKNQSYFGSLRWYLIPITAYFTSFTYAAINDNYANTTFIRSFSILIMSTLVKRIDVFLNLFERKSQLGSLSNILVVNLLMPQGLILSFARIMQNSGLSRAGVLCVELFGNVVCGFANISLNILSQYYTAKEAGDNLDYYIEFIENDNLENNEIELQIMDSNNSKINDERFVINAEQLQLISGGLGPSIV